ncbi:hypothetical protein L218DRAFT_63219 [Marasmius fiardii PR-910]|nr:hypothetical protein L218DRAFT_63219 [Marasmius fiardii PR-910]
MSKKPTIAVQDTSPSPNPPREIKRAASDGSKQETPDVRVKAAATSDRNNKASSLAVPSDKQSDAASKKNRPRSVTPDNASQKVKKPSPAPPSLVQKPSIETRNAVPHTVLEPVAKIPWDGSTFRLGYGVNALTGESTPSCALQWDDKSVKNPKQKIARSKTSIDVIHLNDLKSLVDGVELEAGFGTGTINIVPHPALEFKAKLASVLAKSSSEKTVLVQYRAHGEFETQFLPRNVMLRPDLNGTPPNEFRERFGDYYIAGYQEGFSCRAIIVCRVKENVTSDSHETVAKAHIEKLMSVGVSEGDRKAESKECALLHVVIDTRGCSPELSSLASLSDINSLAETLKSLTQSTKNPPGTPFTALLHHYRYYVLATSKIKTHHGSCSTLNPNILPPRLDGVHATIFAKAREMREFYAHLQAFLIHPALRNFKSDRNNINKALKSFELARRTLFLRPSRSKSEPDHESIYKELKGLIDRSAILDSRYEFIRTVKNMDCSIRSFVPTGNSCTYKWECGKTGGKVTDNVCGFKVMEYGSGYKAYEVTWSASVTALSKGRMLLKKLQVGGGGDAQYMEFRVIPTKEVPSPPVIPRIKGHGIFAVPYNGSSGDNEIDDGERFLYRMVGGPVFIIGWTLACEWEGSHDNRPLIKVPGEKNFILSDHASICLDMSKSSRWTCQVTFVFQCSFNFPDLNLKPGSGDGMMTEAKSLVPSPTIKA